MERQTKVGLVDWSTIETVLLDMDGTLLDLEFDNFFWLKLIPEEYAKKHKLTIEKSNSLLQETYQKYKNTLSWYCTDFWAEKLDLDIIALKRSVSERVAYRKGTLSFLQQVLKKDKKLYLVTNAHPDTLKIKISKKDFSPYFVELLSSHETGYPKEDITFWRTIEKRWNFDKSKSLFVDDSQLILEKASQFGIGQVIGVDHPDTSKKPISFDNFVSVNQLDELLK